MNEMRFPEVPQSAPPPPEPQPPREAGSLALGVALAWIINVVGGAIAVGIVLLLLRHPGSAVSPLIALGWIPLAASIGLGVWMILKGPRRTGIGIFIGIGSIWAVQLLLMAACFGLLIAFSGH